jgi:hypothetical protein
MLCSTCASAGIEQPSKRTVMERSFMVQPSPREVRARRAPAEATA